MRSQKLREARSYYHSSYLDANMNLCCVKCFDEHCIQEFIRNHEQRGDCDYCGSEDVHIADVEEVAHFIREGVERVYEDAANRVAYESAEGGYQLPTTDMADILQWEWCVFGEALDDPTELMKDLGCYDGTPYVRQDPYGPPSGGVEEISRWEKFCARVKQERRYTLFYRNEEAGTEDDADDPGTFIRDVAREMQEHLLRTLDAGVEVYRARRKQNDQPLGHRDLTSPPPERAVSSRMSPPGIPAFYGALDRDTALAEVRPGLGDEVAIARFEVRKPLLVLDLSEIPSPASRFSEEYWFHFEEFIRPFLRQFAEDIARPIRAEDSPIEYTPAQVFSEFVRVFLQVSGILYRSSMRPGGVCVVLFRGPEISSDPDQPDETAWLTYHRHAIHRITGIEFRHSDVTEEESDEDASV